MLGNDRKTTGGRFGEKLVFMNKLAEGVGPKWTGTSIKETRQFERSVAARMKIDVGGAGSVKGLLEAVYQERVTPSSAGWVALQTDLYEAMQVVAWPSVHCRGSE